MKRIKAINGYTIYQLTQRDVNNEFYNATAGNYNIYLSSDIREYGLQGSTPEYDDIETFEICLEICDGVTAIAYEIAGDDAKLETIESLENIINIARENNLNISVDYLPDEYADTTETITINFKYLWDAIRDINADDIEIFNIYVTDNDFNIVSDIVAL